MYLKLDKAHSAITDLKSRWAAQTERMAELQVYYCYKNQTTSFSIFYTFCECKNTFYTLSFVLLNVAQPCI